MNPENQLMLAEIQKLLEKQLIDIDTAMEKRFVDSEITMEQHTVDSELHREASVSAIEVVADKLENWRIETDGTVDYLRLDIAKLTEHCHRSVIDAAATSPGLMPIPAPPVEQAALRPIRL